MLAEAEGQSAEEGMPRGGEDRQARQAGQACMYTATRRGMHEHWERTLRTRHASGTGAGRGVVAAGTGEGGRVGGRKGEG